MKLFLAGTAGDKDIVLENKPKYVLESFYYIKDWQIRLIKECDMFLLDSGAFTFMNSNKGNINWDEYVERYAEFINKYDVKYFFELDIDSVVGIKEVERLRRILEKRTGKQSIPVWHVSRGKDYFIKMCQEYDYVAFGGILTDGLSSKVILKYLPWFTQTAHRYNCKIHALGLTCKGVETYGVDSADSTSWLSGARFGAIYSFKNGALKSTSFKNRRIVNPKKANEHNLKEWIKYQKYLDKK